MCLRGFVVLFFGLVFLLPVASLPSLAPSSSNMPIACASILPASAQNASLEKPALGCAAFAAPRASVPLLTAAKRVFTRAKIEIETALLSLGGNGNAVIGTTSPAQTLDVWQNIASTDAAISIRNLASGAATYLDVSSQSNYVALNLSGGTQYWTVGEKGNTNFTVHDFTNNTDPFIIVPAAPNDSLYIASSGNVGIGTTAPAKLLHIYSGGDSQGLTETTSASNEANWRVKNSSGDTAEIGIYGSGVTYGSIAAREAYAYATRNLNLIADGAGNVIKFETGGNSEKMRIDASGNVGIVTASPDFRTAHARIDAG